MLLSFHLETTMFSFEATCNSIVSRLDYNMVFFIGRGQPVVRFSLIVLVAFIPRLDISSSRAVDVKKLSKEMWYGYLPRLASTSVYCNNTLPPYPKPYRLDQCWSLHPIRARSTLRSHNEWPPPDQSLYPYLVGLPLINCLQPCLPK